MDRLSPQEAGKLRKPVVEGADELPLIRAFSDIAWIMWTGLAETLETDPENLHFFMSLSSRMTPNFVMRPEDLPSH